MTREDQVALVRALDRRLKSWPDVDSAEFLDDCALVLHASRDLGVSLESLESGAAHWLRVAFEIKARGLKRSGSASWCREGVSVEADDGKTRFLITSGRDPWTTL